MPFGPSSLRAIRGALTLSVALVTWPALGAEIDRIASFSAGDAPPCADRSPDLAVQPGGSFLLIWQRSGCPSSATRKVRAQRFDATGRPVAPAVELWDGILAHVVPLPDGGFAAVSEFETALRPSGPPGIGLHRLDAFGRPVGGSVVVALNPDGVHFNTQPRLAVAPNGSVVVVWRDPGGVPRGRFFNPALQPLTEALPLSTLAASLFGEIDPDIAVQADGTALAVWAHFVDTNEYQIVGRRFSSLGVPLSQTFPISRSERFRINGGPRVLPRGTDGWWVGWNSQQGLAGGPPPASEIRIGRLGADGTPVGTEQPFTDPEAIETFALGAEPAGSLLVLVGERSGTISGRWFDSVGAPASDRTRISASGPLKAAFPTLPDRSSGAISTAWFKYSQGSFADADLSGSLISPPCTDGQSAACLGPGGRFRVEIVWRTAGESGTAKPLPLGANVATFGLKNTADHDVTVLLAGPGSKNLTFAATTLLALEIRVTDRTTGLTRTFSKAAGNFESRRIVNALPSGASGDLDPRPKAEANEADDEIFADPAAGPVCVPTSRVLCLLGGRFRAELLAEQDPRPTSTLLRTDKSGGLAFPRAPETPVVLLSMIDGRATNGKFWVYLGGLASAAYQVKITEVATGRTKTYTNPAGRLESRADRTAF
ncbi:MAG TPA: hypothetical protein VN851_19420 [Thermoanaerobaculia bacterium]|nr:hypothetical protein [Thermoanaerobaculia bacterium]